jgi:putative glutamine amidotransferase
VSRPRVGVTTYPRDRQGRPRFHLPSAYIDSVRAAGGAPVLLPPGDPEPARLLDGLEGLVLAGGGDVHPARFGAGLHPTSYGHCEERDESEFALLAAALERALPTLAICRGAQILNVLRGGDLLPHLPEHVGEDVPHRISAELHTKHRVRLLAGSQLAALYGSGSLEVASWHHQAVGRLGAGLEAVAFAEDGVIEALELADAPWLLAVQWHPELEPEDGAAGRRLFDRLVTLGRERA